VTYNTIAVGDIAPRENIPKAEKRRLEVVCTHKFIFQRIKLTTGEFRIGSNE
jgi:hypothetical protein